MIFIDTSAFIALNLENDKFHAKAMGWWQKNQGAEIVTSNYIIAETLSWLRYIVGKEKAVAVGEFLLESSDIKILKIGQSDEIEAWNLFKKLPGKGISFVDCLSFALMTRNKIRDVFTFDTDFDHAGFKTIPK